MTCCQVSFASYFIFCPPAVLRVFSRVLLKQFPALATLSYADSAIITCRRSMVRREPCCLATRITRYVSAWVWRKWLRPGRLSKPLETPSISLYLSVLALYWYCYCHACRTSMLLVIMPQTKQANSRAIAVITTLYFLPLRIIR